MGLMLFCPVYVWWNAFRGSSFNQLLLAEAIWRTNMVMCHLLTFLWGSQIQWHWMFLHLRAMSNIGPAMYQTKCSLSGLLESVLVSMICRAVCYFLTLSPSFNTKVPLDYVSGNLLVSRFFELLKFLMKCWKHRQKDSSGNLKGCVLI